MTSWRGRGGLGQMEPTCTSGLSNTPATLFRLRPPAWAGCSRCWARTHSSRLADFSGLGEECGPSNGVGRDAGLAREASQKAYLPRRRVVLGWMKQ